MHPAVSIILFTTLSGLGFGLLAFLGLGYPDVEGFTAVVFFALAFALAGGGLISSTFHLGHPERALKAFTQWRSSWLSREAWLAAITLAVMGIYAFALVILGTRIAPLGLLGAILWHGTIFTTSMIYTQMKTVPRWHHWSTPLLFFAYAIAGGALLSGQTALAPILILGLGALQLWAWQSGDTRFRTSGTTLATATGLGNRGDVRSFEPPHTGNNYLTREMVHVVARKHAMKLRIISLVLFALLIYVIFLSNAFSHILAAVAVLSHLAGALVSRWLFFAEAEHVVGLYYGKR